MLYVRFPLSLRNVEDLLHERGVDVSHETVWFWWNRFGPMFASEIARKRRNQARSHPNWQWHFDEVFVKNYYREGRKSGVSHKGKYVDELYKIDQLLEFYGGIGIDLTLPDSDGCTLAHLLYKYGDNWENSIHYTALKKNDLIPFYKIEKTLTSLGVHLHKKNVFNKTSDEYKQIFLKKIEERILAFDELPF